MIPSILHSGKGKTVETVKRSGFSEEWREGGVRRSTEDFYGRENALYDTVMVDRCRSTFVHTHRMCNTKSEA